MSIPEIMDDSVRDEVAARLRELLTIEPALTVPVLDALARFGMRGVISFFVLLAPFNFHDM